MDNDQLQNALSQRVKDFEDMLQYQCAKAANCEYIISGNKRHFKDFCELPLIRDKMEVGCKYLGGE